MRTTTLRGGIPEDIPRAYRKIVKQAHQQGWKVHKKTQGWMLEAPSGGKVMLHRTPGRGRAFANLLAEMKRLGYS